MVMPRVISGVEISLLDMFYAILEIISGFLPGFGAEIS